MTFEQIIQLPDDVAAKVQDIARRMPDVTPEEAAWIEQFMPDQVNACDGCTLCCVAPSITGKDVESPLTADKPAGEACQYCDMQNGCRVYNARPSICKGYMCHYTLGLLPYHPKETGIAWTAQPLPPENTPPGMPEKGAWVATGHSLDGAEAMRDERNKLSVVMLLNMGAAVVILRDPVRIVQFVCNKLPALPGDEVLVRKVPVNPLDPNHDDWLEELAEMAVVTMP